MIVRLRKEVWRIHPSSWGEVVPVTETGTLEEDGVWGCCSETSLSMRTFQDTYLKMLAGIVTQTRLARETFENHEAMNSEDFRN